MTRLIEDGDAPVCVRKGYHEWRYPRDTSTPARCAACGKFEKFEYPTDTLYSPRSSSSERIGKVVRVGGKSKFKATEVKPLPPLKKDTLSGYGEKRKRYIR
jgi:hypothetical protein